jgi:hypothetical protein
MQELGERGSYIPMEQSGSNALDFHIAYYLGALAAAEPAGFFHIISKDTGFDPLIHHLKDKKIHVARSPSIEEMPCFLAQKVDPPTETTAPHSGVVGTVQRTCRATLGVSSDVILQKAITDLQKRRQSRPRTMKTLTSTLHAACGKELPASAIKAVVNSLVQKRYVIVQGAKVSYSLPDYSGAKAPSAI